jgi:hypothetical protein
MQTLIIATLPLSLFGQRDRNDQVNAFKEACIVPFFCNHPTKELSYFRMILVFQLIKKLAGARAALIEEQGCTTLHGQLSPKESCHIVLVWIISIVGTGKLQIATATEKKLMDAQSPPTDDTGTRGY